MKKTYPPAETLPYVQCPPHVQRTRDAVQILGGTTEVARVLNRTKQAVDHWNKRGVSLKMANTLACMSGIPVIELLPPAVDGIKCRQPRKGLGLGAGIAYGGKE